MNEIAEAIKHEIITHETARIIDTCSDAAVLLLGVFALWWCHRVLRVLIDIRDDIEDMAP